MVMIIFNKDGEDIIIEEARNTKEPLEFLLITGAPLNEPISR